MGLAMPVTAGVVKSPFACTTKAGVGTAGVTKAGVALGVAAASMAALAAAPVPAAAGDH